MPKCKKVIIGALVFLLFLSGCQKLGYYAGLYENVGWIDDGID